MTSFLPTFALAYGASTLLASGFGHLRNPRSFAALLREHEVLPRSLSAPVAGLTMSVELMLGVGCLAGLVGGHAHSRRGIALAALAAMALLAGLFLVYLARLLRSGQDTSCGCTPFSARLTSASYFPAAGLALAAALGLIAHLGGAASPTSATLFLAVAWGATSSLLAALVPATVPRRLGEEIA